MTSKNPPALCVIFILFLAGLLVCPRAIALTLFETPDDKDQTIVRTISGAKKSVEVEVYELTAADVISALIEKSKAGALVRVILNPANVYHEATNAPAMAQLQAGGVSVQYSQAKAAGGSYDSTHFAYDHAKLVIADAGLDGQVALVTTINLSPDYLGVLVNGSESLNFGIVDKKAKDVAYLETVFDCDWNKTVVPAPEGTDLVISPINARQTLLAEIQGAKTKIHFFNQELSDKQIIAAFVAAAGRGVEVEGLVSPNLVRAAVIAPILSAGGHILALNMPYEHAKAAIIDGGLVYVGSVNYTAGSMDNNREVGIEAKNKTLAKELEKYFQKFWPSGVTVPAN
ncbi:MAG TPA: phosphatidylserine/phosphatidylglycerophosphate/cardiolipin synthase family protein [Opitutaceae bacterium]|jgi:phosphatidylserine/phosphatidylglycerophosphate/cardiolipin synthase-like enzyme|nr:phosphatidylserine/phosphatidylglycerophosphate/cardiolipin synthase family protein [Opitutaceae bacterium]